MFFEAYVAIRDFMELGGPVLKVIAVTILLMWILIFERILYFRRESWGWMIRGIDAWESRPERQSRPALGKGPGSLPTCGSRRPRRSLTLPSPRIATACRGPRRSPARSSSRPWERQRCLLDMTIHPRKQDAHGGYPERAGPARQRLPAAGR